MLIKKSLPLLVIPALLTLPAGIARADNIDVQTGDQKVTIDRNNGIRIESGSREIIVPQRSPRSSHLSSRLRILGLPQLKKPLRCQGRESHQDTHTHHSGGVSRTQSSISTRVCQ
ncbi:MAG: hypothetical protein ACFB4I_10890 [Cyanophyceae cyanobacterium]